MSRPRNQQKPNITIYGEHVFAILLRKPKRDKEEEKHSRPLQISLSNSIKLSFAKVAASIQTQPTSDILVQTKTSSTFFEE